MKKLVLFTAAFAAIFVFCGCGKDSGNSSKDNSAAEIKECAKNMRRLAKTIKRYREKHDGEFPRLRNIEKIVETDVTLECPISQKSYRIEPYYTSVAADKVLIECKHKDKTLRANLYGRIDAIPNDHYILSDENRMPYEDAYILYKGE